MCVDFLVLFNNINNYSPYLIFEALVIYICEEGTRGVMADQAEIKVSNALNIQLFSGRSL